MVIRHQEFHTAKIADELHDEVLQTMALAGRRLSALADEPGVVTVAERLRGMVGQLNDEVGVLRGILSTLHPVLLRHVGLAEGCGHSLDRSATGTG
ncbi:histidine kinase [Amycolatopsis sp. NPDC051071]|uniref:histidine kinase n=1 Tax=Amycolatopsis sp. NPDC051071 TaxID=3154637 RepID=UPI00341B5A41